MLRSLVLVAAGGIIVAGVITVVGVRRGALHAAETSITHKAQNIKDNAERLRDQLAAGTGARALRLRDMVDQIRSSVQVSDARLVFVDSNGTVATYEQITSTAVGRRLLGDDPQGAELLSLPTGTTTADFSLAAVAKGATTTTLRRGNSVYFAESIPSLTRARYDAVIIVSQEVDTESVRRATTAFLLAALIAIAACVALSAWLARRLTKQLTTIDATARALGAGDLSARVVVDNRTDREVAEVAATLNRMAGDLDGARRTERSFLQAVSHDLRTPLTSIRGYAEALADGTLDATDEDARRRAAEVISTEARRLERLVRDLLDLSRLDAHEFSLRPRPGDAVELVRSTVAGFAPQAQTLGITLLDTTGDDTAMADLDLERFGQIIANLVENALKYARTTVEVAFHATTAAIEVTVADDGPGIPSADQARVFDRLYTARPAPGRAVGTGLGLSIVHELARTMGGQARLVSSDAQGTTFAVTVARG